jgi:uncharacterized phage protein (TIGR01671 family)
MRTIKFRAKNLDGEWVYGFYVEEERQTLNGFEKKYFIVNDGYDYVKPETVGQFTGLVDMNGNEIYEGDIVKTNIGVGFVRYNAKQWYYEVAEVNEPLDNECKHSGIPEEDWEVMGNIHDNPEILKGGNQ